MVFFGSKQEIKPNFAARKNREDKMSKTKWIVLLLIVSSILVLLGALAKIQHWENLKVLMLLGLALQFGVIFYALVLMVIKKK